MENVDSNFWFYTLSAIPQTLGAVVALFATFSIFSISTIRELGEKTEDSVKDYLLVLNSKLEIHEIENFTTADVLDALEKGLDVIHRDDKNYTAYARLYDLYRKEIMRRNRYFSPDSMRIYEFLKQKKERISSLATQRKKVLRLLFITLVTNVFVIILSLTLLPMYDMVTNFHIPLVGTVLGLAAGSLILTANSTYKIAHFDLKIK